MEGSASLSVLVFAIAVVAFVGARAMIKGEPDRVIARFLVLGFVAKLAGSAARFTVMGDLYGGRGDFRRYFENGTEIARILRTGSIPEQARSTGTHFMDFIVGVVYSVLPNQLWVGFVVFALLSFVGACLFLQAFRLAVPYGNHRMYAGLVFFTPTMVFWPSSIGKEAWLVFALGVATYGAARVLRQAKFGYVIAMFGGVCAFMVRPHIGALFGLAFAGAFLLRFRDPELRRGAARTVVGLLIVAIGAGFAFANFGDELPAGRGVEDATFDDIAAETIRRTTTGGSEFDSRPVRSPGDFVHAAITVPFRPFPTEGHNIQSQLAGLEGVFLILLFLIFLPRLVALPRAILRLPYVAMASAYSVGFIIAFSNVGNFGILTRQRAQLLPFLFVLMAYDWHRRNDERGPVLVPRSLDVASPESQKRPIPVAAAAVASTNPAPPVYTQGSFDLEIDLPPDAVQPRPGENRGPPAPASDAP